MDIAHLWSVHAPDVAPTEEDQGLGPRSNSEKSGVRRSDFLGVDQAGGEGPCTVGPRHHGSWSHEDPPLEGQNIMDTWLKILPTRKVSGRIICQHWNDICSRQHDVIETTETPVWQSFQLSIYVISEFQKTRTVAPTRRLSLVTCWCKDIFNLCGTANTIFHNYSIKAISLQGICRNFTGNCVKMSAIIWNLKKITVKLKTVLMLMVAGIKLFIISLGRPILSSYGCKK